MNASNYVQSHIYIYIFTFCVRIQIYESQNFLKNKK